MLFKYSNILPFFANYSKILMSHMLLKTSIYFSCVFLRKLSNVGRNTHQCLFVKNQCSLSQLKNLSAVKKIRES